MTTLCAKLQIISFLPSKKGLKPQHSLTKVDFQKVTTVDEITNAVYLTRSN